MSHSVLAYMASLSAVHDPHVCAGARSCESVAAACTLNLPASVRAGVSLPAVDYDALRAAIVENCNKEGLQPLDSFLTKIIQLYEVRA